MVYYYILQYCMVLHCWLRRAGCILQDTYLLYVHCPQPKCLAKLFSTQSYWLLNTTTSGEKLLLPQLHIYVITEFKCLPMTEFLTMVCTSSSKTLPLPGTGHRRPHMCSGQSLWGWYEGCNCRRRWGWQDFLGQTTTRLTQVFRKRINSICIWHLVHLKFAAWPHTWYLLRAPRAVPV